MAENNTKKTGPNTKSRTEINKAALAEKNLTTNIEETDKTLNDKEEMSVTGSAPIANGQPGGLEDTPQGGNNGKGNSTAKVQESTIPDALREGLDNTQQAQQDIVEQAEQRKEEDVAIKEDRVSAAQDFAERQTGILQDKDKALAEVEDRGRELSQTTTDTLVGGLEEQRDLALDKANLELEEQKISNQQAIDQAERDVEVEKQKASWAMNKLGLGFGSGIIQEVQSIATRGATEIAKLKVTAKKLEVDTALNISRLEFDYTKEINGLISTNVQNQLTLDEKTAQRIADTQNNTLLTDREKEERIMNIEEDYLNQTRANEDNLRVEQERLSDKYINQTVDLQNSIRDEQNRQKTTISEKMSSGEWMNLPVSKKKEFAQASGMTVTELERLNNNYVHGQVYNRVATLIGEDTIISDTERDAITNKVKSLTESGFGLNESVNRAVDNVISKNPDYVKLKQVKSSERSAAIRSANLSGRPRSSGGGSSGGGSGGGGDGEGGNTPITEEQRQKYFSFYNKNIPNDITTQGELEAALTKGAIKNYQDGNLLVEDLMSMGGDEVTTNIENINSYDVDKETKKKSVAEINKSFTEDGLNLDTRVSYLSKMGVKAQGEERQKGDLYFKPTKDGGIQVKIDESWRDDTLLEIK